MTPLCQRVENSDLKRIFLSNRLHAQVNTQQGLHHSAVLDLTKAYDRVDREILLEVLKEWLSGEVVNMVRATLELSTVRTRGDPTDVTAEVSVV